MATAQPRTTDTRAERRVTPADSEPDVFNPHEPAFLANPYPTYARFRASDPVQCVMPYNAVWVFRYEDVKTVLSDTGRFPKNPKDPKPAPGPFEVLQYMPAGVFSADPPRHAELRAIMDPLFTTAIEGAASFAEDTARVLLDQKKGTQRIDLMSDYALPLPAAVLGHVLGIPTADWQGVVSWVQAIAMGHDITQSRSAQAAAGTCTMAIIAYLQGFARGCPHAHNAHGMVPAMAVAGVEQGLSPEDVQMSAMNLAVAGYLSTTYLIGTGVLSLLKHPDQLELLRDRPDLMDGAVAEMLRFDAPAQLADRVAVEDVTLAGATIEAGTRVSAVIGSANHDADVFANPDTFDIQRDASAQLAFGDGIHYCIGAPLARIVTPVALRVLLEVAPELACAGTPQWQTDPYLRGPTSLPVAIR